MWSGGARGHFPIDLDEICQNIVTLDPADVFSGGPKRRDLFVVSAQLRRARGRSLAFHEGNVAFSKEIALLPSPGHFPIDFDEICQNIVSFDPADAFSGPEPPPLPFTREIQLFPIKSPHFPPQKHSVLSVGCFSFAVWGGRREPAFTQVGYRSISYKDTQVRTQRVLQD